MTQIRFFGFVNDKDNEEEQLKIRPVDVGGASDEI